MLFNQPRRLSAGATLILTLFALTGVAEAKSKPKPKKVSLSAQVRSVNAKKGTTLLRYATKVRVKSKARGHSIRYKTVYKNVQARIASNTKLLGGDRTHDGLLGVTDLKKGDRVKVKGSMLGSRITLSDLINSSSLPKGDLNGDGVPDSVDTNDVLATLVSVNADQHLLTLEVTASPDQPDLVGEQVTVSMVDGALLSLGDRNKDGVRDWNDIQESDQFALMLIAPVDPSNAQATLAVDLTSLGKKGKDRSHHINAIPMGGEVTAVDPETGTVTVQPSIAGVSLPEFTLNVSESTQFEVDDVNDDSVQDLNDISVGDRIKALVSLPADPENLQAAKIISKAPEHSGHGSARLSGQVVSIDQATNSMDFAVEEGPLSGQTVTMGWGDSSSLEVDDVNNDGVADWQDVQAGDQMSVIVADISDLSIITAWDQGGGGDSTDPGSDRDSGNGGDTPHNPPGVLIGTVDTIDLHAHTISVLVVGGSLDGQTVTVNLDWSTALGTVDNNNDGRNNWRDVQPGDNVGIVVDNLTDLNAWIIADSGSEPLPNDFGQAGAVGDNPPGEEDN